METTRALTKTGGITETGLKWIALVTMVMDHIHYFFGFTGMIPEWFSMVGRLGAPLFLFCLVEGFTHTHSRKKYFAKVYILSAAMSALLFFMAFGGILVRPDGFYPGNGMMTTFAVLMVIWQGIDWLGQKKILPGLAAVILPLAWPILASQLSVAFPASLGVAFPASLDVATSPSFRTRMGTVNSFVEPSGYSISILPLYFPGLSRLTPSSPYSVMSVTTVPSGSSSSRFTTLSDKSASSPA